MINLLSANFSRLKKNKIFWIGIGAMFIIGLLMTVTRYQDSLRNNNIQVSVDNIFFGYTVLIGAFCAVLCSLFIGTEYSDGTIRNKLVVGHNRSTIYLSNLIISTVAGLLTSLAFIITVSAVGIPLLGWFQADIKTVLLFFISSIMLIIAFTSIFTLISMSNQNKAIVAVICILSFFLLFFLAAYIDKRLTAPEFYNAYTFTDNAGNMVSESMPTPDYSMPNPDYLDGTLRDIYTFFYDFLPTGQAMQLSNMSATHLWQMPLYSLLITIAATLGGMLYFRKKDLK